MERLRKHLLRIGDGMPTVLEDAGRRAFAGTWRDRATTLAVIALGVLLWWQMIDVWPWLTVVLVAPWVVKAWRAADAEDRREEQLAEAREQQARTAEEIYLRMFVALIGDEPGIHLDVLLDAMQRADPGWPHLDRDQLRGLLDGLGVPVRRQLRVGTRTGRAGIHHHDATEALRTYLARDPSPEQ